MMTQQEFDDIYPTKLTPKQHQVIKLFLQGDSEEAIAKCLGVNNKSSVRHHITNICQRFGFQNEEGEHYRQRKELISLFDHYKPELVSAQLRESAGISSDNQIGRAHV